MIPIHYNTFPPIETDAQRLEQILDPLGSLVRNIAVDLKYVDRLAVPVASKLKVQPCVARPIEQGVKVGVR